MAKAGPRSQNEPSRDKPMSADDEALIACGLRTLEAEAGGLTALGVAMRDGLGATFVAAAALIKAARGRVIVTGMGKSGHVGNKIAATLSSTGTPAYFVHPAEASHGDLGMITPDDVIIALSWSGETAELKNLIDYSRRFRIGLIAVTADGASALGNAADVTLVLPQAREACPHNLAPTTSSLMQLALGDALAIALLESRGFTAIDFRNLHPGGRLGAALTFVRDLMHSGPEMPLKPVGTRMSDALVEMSAKRFGCVGITNVRGRPRRHHHRRRPAPPHASRPHRSAGRGRYDQRARHRAPRPARQRSAGDPQLEEAHRAVRGRRPPRGRRRAHARFIAGGRGVKLVRLKRFFLSRREPNF